MRKSEIFALTWEDFDFQKQIVRINKSRNYLNKIGMITKIPKNNSSNRIIYISKNMCEGHSNITTTLNIYTHVLDDLDKNAANYLEIN